MYHSLLSSIIPPLLVAAGCVGRCAPTDAPLKVELTLPLLPTTHSIRPHTLPQPHHSTALHAQLSRSLFLTVSLTNLCHTAVMAM